MIFYQLLRPFQYLRINQPEKKWADWFLPGVAAAVATAIAYQLRGQLDMFGPEGVVSSILAFVQNLPGFYIAALAAIATFGRNDIDEIMPGNPPPSIRTITASGSDNRIHLTRRRFLCLLFAYLTMECIGLTLFSILTINIAPIVRDAMSESASHMAFGLGTFVFSFLLVQMLVATLWGLYYLGDRIHQPDS